MWQLYIYTRKNVYAYICQIVFVFFFYKRVVYQSYKNSITEINI